MTGSAKPNSQTQIYRSTDLLIYRSTDPQIHRPTDPQIHRSADPQIYRSADPLIYRSTDLQIQSSTVPQIYRSTDPQIYRSTDPHANAPWIRCSLRTLLVFLIWLICSFSRHQTAVCPLLTNEDPAPSRKVLCWGELCLLLICSDITNRMDYMQYFYPINLSLSPSFLFPSPLLHMFNLFAVLPPSLH